MNYHQTLFVTHVELSSHFIKIHGQTNRVVAKQIECSATTMISIFKSYPPPVINMLYVECMVAVYYKNAYFRGKFISADAGKTANILLIDLGCMVTVEVANVRVLDVARKASDFLLKEPAQANEFILNRCVISEYNAIGKIRNDLMYFEIPYNVDDEIGNIKRISLKWKNRDYTEYLICSKTCQPITADQQKKYLMPKPMTAIVARPVNQTTVDTSAVRSSINNTGMQMISHHLGVRNSKVPQNMPSYHPRVSPSMDFNSNHTDNGLKSSPAIAISQKEQLPSHYMPTFMSDTLLVHGRHQVYVSYVDDGPYMFSVQLKSAEKRMEEMMAAIAKCELFPLSRKPALGMACLSRFSEDNNIYRAVIKSIHPDSCQLLYVDYGNSEKVLHNNIYDIPEQFLRLKTFAERFSIAGLKTLPPLPDRVKAVFKDVVADKTLDMVVVPADGKAFVQYCELSLNGESMLRRLNDAMSEMPKFIEPGTLNDDDFVVIRYVESPKLFCVQQTKNIVEYNAMMDKLCQYCMTAPSLNKFQIGMACAARFKNDSEWYRAEIVDVNGNNALIRFVDYGIELKTEITALKEMRYEFLRIPKQAVRCCLFGFDKVQTFSNSSQDQMELLAEDSVGERRNFRVKIHGTVNDTILVNLTDESQSPHLNLSLRMVQLSMPQKSLRQYELQVQNKMSQPRSANVSLNGAPSANDDQHLYPAANEKVSSDSGFHEGASTSTRISSWDTSQQTPDRDLKATARNIAQNSSRDDTGSSGVYSANLSSPGGGEPFKIDAKESKFYKNQHYVSPSLESNDQRNARQTKPYTSSNLRRDTLSPEGLIDPDTRIPTVSIPINSTQEVKLTWLFSPLEFYVATAQSDADLDYTMQMKDIHHFYKNISPMTKKAAIGTFVIAKHSKNNQLHRAKIINFNDKLNKYKAQLIDVGALTIVHASDVYEMDKVFANLECQAIKCSLDGVALRTNRFDMEGTIEKLTINRTMLCKFIRKTADTFYVDIEVDRTNVKEVLIREKYLSILARDVDIERLVGQTVMARIVSVKEFSSFQIVISGCETIFEASSPVSNINPIPDFKKLPINIAIPIRIDKLLIGKTFAVTPLIEMFGQTPPSPICNLPFFSDNFKAIVVHWESYNVAYVQSATAQNLSESLLNELFEFYDKSGETLHEFVPQTLCAAKSAADDNWYRAEILSETPAEVRVRYLDYGNCESIPKGLVKRLESKFCTTAVLAVKVFLPLGKVYSDREMSVDEIVNLTADVSLDLRVLAFHADNWIVDLLKDDNSITSTIKTKNCCKTMNLDELKRHIADIEVVRKATKLQCQKERANSQAKAAAVPIVKEQSQPQKPPASQNIQPSSAPQNTQLDKKVSQNTQPDKKAAPSETTSKTKAFISHIDRPDRFYLQVSSITDDLNRLQEDIQIVAPSLPALDDFSTDTRCIVRYSVDDQWYRAAIIDSDTKITSILFIDYGNTDTIDDNSLIRSMNDAFDRIPGFAIPCALPLEAKDRIEWSDESCELLKSLVETELEFEYVCKGKSNNFVKLYHGERDLMQELVQKGHAIKLDSIISGANCYISHINSISDFYVQLEKDTDALEKVADYLLDESKFEVMTDIQEGVVCAAKYSEDGLWYRGKIKSHQAGNTEVCFIDYGNSSMTNELRIIPTEIANAPSLAKYCSMVKPKDVQYWSESAERRFVELTDSGTIFLVDVISPGKQSVVDLFVNDKSILEDISNLCDKYSLSALENTLQSNANANVASETIKAFIVDGSPDAFYIQMESSSGELDQLLVSLESASTWPVLDEVAVGQMCAALFDGAYYRAKIFSLSSEGVTVHYVDFGNQSLSTDLRKLPENLHSVKHLAISCALKSKKGIFSPQTIESFASLSKEDVYVFKYVSKESSPAIVELFLQDGTKFEEKSATEIPASTANVKVKAYISERIGPNHFYIQLNNDMEEAMVTANEFPLLEDSCKCAGQRCAAFWEEAFYRAEILAVDDTGIKVHFIDYGNESYATDLRKLPENLEKIERASMLCKLYSENDRFSSDLVAKFIGLDLDQEYEFEMKTQSSPCIVRLYVNGELFSDGQSVSDMPKNSHIEANSDSIAIVKEVESSNERRVVVKENSLNGMDAIDISSTSTDTATEADRIEQVHFESVVNGGMGSFQPSNA